MTNVRSDTAERWEQELLPPREIRPCWRKKINTVYLCVLYVCVCVWERKRERENPLVHCESYVFVTLTMALWHKWKILFFSSSVKHFYLSLSNCQHFSLTPSDSPFVYLSISPAVSLPLSVSPLVFISFPSPGFISSFTLWIWYLSSREWGRESPKQRIQMQRRQGEMGIEDTDRSTEEKGEGLVRGISEGGNEN